MLCAYCIIQLLYNYLLFSFQAKIETHVLMAWKCILLQILERHARDRREPTSSTCQANGLLQKGTAHAAALHLGAEIERMKMIW